MNRADVDELIRRHEGVRYTVYADTEGHPTIGIGFNLDKEGARERIKAIHADYDRVYTGNDALSEKQVTGLFAIDLEDAIESAKVIVANFAQHPDSIQSVIVDMVFNLGAAGFAKFKNTIAALERQDYCSAATEMGQSLWAEQVGARAHENIKRVLEFCK